MSNQQRRRLAALPFAFALVACNAGSSPGTGLHVSSAWNGLQVDQLEFAVTNPSGAELHERRPLVPQGPLASGVDVVILLPDEMAGERLGCRVTAYFGGGLVRRGETLVDVVGGSIVDVVITLGNAPAFDAAVLPDAGAPPDTGAGRDAGTTRDTGPGPRDNGQRCNGGKECASGNCVDGVCCDTSCAAACQACTVPGRVGSCSTVPAGVRDARCAAEAPASCGLDGTCGANGLCRTYPAGTVCAPGMCAGNTVTGGSRCDGNGVCAPSMSQSCGAFTCDSATRACRTSCSSSVDCVAPAGCSGGVCGSFKPLGTACTGGTDCASGNCVDGVCCSTASCGLCLACNVSEGPGGAGTCRPVPNGTGEPHHLCPVQPVTMCGLNGTCNGAGSCAAYPDGTMCRQAKVCLGGVCR